MLYVTAGHEQAGAVEVPWLTVKGNSGFKIRRRRLVGESMLNRDHFYGIYIILERIKHGAQING